MIAIGKDPLLFSVIVGVCAVRPLVANLAYFAIGVKVVQQGELVC
jgi:hypothetical protein